MGSLCSQVSNGIKGSNATDYAGLKLDCTGVPVILFPFFAQSAEEPNIFCRALLERNLPVMDRAAAVLSEEIRFAPAEHKTAWSFGGIRADGCYHQHGPQIQFGNYGGEFLANIAYWSNILKETHWELSPEQWRIMRHLTFNGFQWVLWRGRMDLLACGRQLGRNAAETKGERTLNAFAQLRNADPGDRAPYDARSAATAEKAIP